MQEFYREYLKKDNAARRQLLYVMNPNKFQACQFLIQYHEQVCPLIFILFMFESTTAALQHAVHVNALNRIFVSAKITSIAAKSMEANLPSFSLLRGNALHDLGLTMNCMCAQVRGDKIIVFSDNIFALREYAQRLRKPFIYGGTSHQERTRVLAAFKRSSEVRLPFL